MPWGSIISSAAGVAGALIGKKGQEETNAANARQAALNRNFQERMSNTAVQRRMADMRQGGINPLLAGKYDASTPAGAMATFGNPGAAATAGFSQVGGTAANVVQIQSKIDQIQAQTNLTNQQAKALGVLATMGEAGGQFLEAVLEKAKEFSWESIDFKSIARDTFGNVTGFMKDRIDKLIQVISIQSNDAFNRNSDVKGNVGELTQNPTGFMK